MFKVNNKDKRHSTVFIVNFEHISHPVLEFLLLTLNMPLPTGWYIANSATNPVSLITLYMSGNCQIFTV